MPIDYKKYPSNWKTEIRPAIMERAKKCCEFCGVKHYSVGSWDGKKFIPIGGNITYDAAGNGDLSYKSARELVWHRNGFFDDKLTIIVLTIAHLDHDVTNNNFSNLKALCQRCHLAYDKEYHKKKKWKQLL